MLEDCKESVILPMLNGEQLEFEIKGLEIMNDDPSDVDVLYARIVDKTGKLQNIVDAIGRPIQLETAKYHKSYNPIFSWKIC